MSYADADAKIKLPLRSQIQIHRRNDLLLLLGNWIEPGNGAEGSIVLFPR